jgi:hypothetical protein
MSRNEQRVRDFSRDFFIFRAPGALLSMGENVWEEFSKG